MPNIATAFKDEISRLCRKEMRKHLEPLRKASVIYRKEISALKRKLQESERRVGALAKRGPKVAAEAADSSSERQTRFVAKGLKSLRTRLGLSAAELAGLLGVTGQSVYNWEQKKSTPRAAQLAQLAELRSLGKKAVRARLDGGGESEVSEEATDKPRRGRPRKDAAVAAEAPRRRGRKPRVAAEAAEATPRKRGRKPRSEAVTEQAAAPRRGRKPRVAAEAVEAAPRKRGRKPRAAAETVETAAAGE
ncbi:helix-turn-helix protein [Tahibacter aquaticus]|uniref:Helix-turn-helix protein n=1 Tax=Tahibacter aquaticus TaxID=520092 RepID=A0A4R6Z4P9_9GAMM|nr:helix-turn-helix transcriptional regulator [Tahibacter aquaticus]TDR46655.1 helix-turn-helix protein [Tahibacter aquaticus]